MHILHYSTVYLITPVHILMITFLRDFLYEIVVKWTVHPRAHLLLFVKESISKSSTWPVVCGHPIYIRGEWFIESLHFNWMILLLYPYGTMTLQHHCHTFYTVTLPLLHPYFPHFPVMDPGLLFSDSYSDPDPSLQLVSDPNPAPVLFRIL